MTTAPVSKAKLVDRVVRGGIPDREWAKRAVRATLTILGQRLEDDEAAALRARLSADLARVIDQAEHDPDLDASELYERIRRVEGATIGDAREHAAVVLRALGELIDDGLRKRLARALPAEVAWHLEPRPRVDLPPYHAPKHAPALTTLATGRVGSLHPLAVAKPERAQRHSVVRNANPHGDSKLSSSRGMTQERLDETLATGHPVSPRSIAEAGDD